MSTTKRSGKLGGNAPHPTDTRPDVPVLPAPRPFVPQRGAFIGMCVLFAIWVGFLVTLYFTTIYPKRHPSKPEQPASAGRVITQ